MSDPKNKSGKSFYKPGDLSNDYNKDLGDPGNPPFTRGIYPEMYRQKLWTMRQYAGYASAEDSNKRYKFLLKQGITGLSVAFDLPTQIGYDSDNPLAKGEVGRVGVAIDSILDMETLFEGIDLQKVRTSENKTYDMIFISRLNKLKKSPPIYKNHAKIPLCP